MFSQLPHNLQLQVEQVRRQVLGINEIKGPLTDTITALYVLVSVVGVIGNGLVCYIVLARKHMQTPRNLFIFNLALADFVLSVTLIPFIRYPNLNRGTWDYGEGLCKLFTSISGTNIFCSSLTIIAIAVDRFIAVTSQTLGSPIKKHQVVTIIICIWSISLIFCTPLLIFYQNVTQFIDLNYLFNVTNNLTNEESNITYNTAHPFYSDCMVPGKPVILYLFRALEWLFILPIPIVTLIIFNYRLHKFLETSQRKRLHLLGEKKKKTEKIKSQSQLSDSLSENGIVQCPNESTSLNEERGSSPSITKKESKRRSRTTILLFLMTCSHAVLWLPFAIFSILDEFYFRNPKHSTTLNQYELFSMDSICVLLAHFSITINPILYGYFNTNFNREFKKLLRLGNGDNTDLVKTKTTYKTSNYAVTNFGEEGQGTSI